MGKALVVLSGGQDSTTALYWAKNGFKEVHAITFDYGQRHAVEIEAAKKIAGIAGVASHEIISVGPVLKGNSPLVNLDKAVEQYASADALPGGLENTFVPARNLFFFSLAANRAFLLQANTIITGACQTDFGGYPDCRAVFLTAMAKAISEGLTGNPHTFDIAAPLMYLDKKAIVLMAMEFPGCYDALAYTHTCYNGEYPPNPFNHASLLRARGFAEAAIADPLIVRAKKEGLLAEDYPDSGLVEGTAYDKRPVVAEEKPATKSPSASDSVEEVTPVEESAQQESKT